MAEHGEGKNQANAEALELASKCQHAADDMVVVGFKEEGKLVSILRLAGMTIQAQQATINTLSTGR